MPMVLRGRPWFFGKSLLMFTEVKGLDVPANVLLHEHEFWIQIHGLPSSFMFVRIGETLGVAIGRVVRLIVTLVVVVLESFCE